MTNIHCIYELAARAKQIICSSGNLINCHTTKYRLQHGLQCIMGVYRAQYTTDRVVTCLFHDHSADGSRTQAYYCADL